MDKLFFDVPEEHEGIKLTWTIRRNVVTRYPDYGHRYSYNSYSYDEVQYIMELEAESGDKWSNVVEGLTDKQMATSVKHLLEQKSVAFRAKLLKEGPVKVCRPTQSL